MHIWDTQNAKAQLSLLLRASEKEPQEIRRHGKPVAIVLSIEDYNELMPKNKKIKKQLNLVEFLRASPLMGTDLSIKRSKKAIEILSYEIFNRYQYLIRSSKTKT